MIQINQPRTAILVGATGLVGGALLEMLIADISFKRIITFSRRPLSIQHPKVEVVETDFIDFYSLEKYFKEADAVFCCIGTTIKQAGSKEQFRKVDYEIPVHLADHAYKNNVRTFIIVSSLGADAKSKNFYLKTKGEMERDLASFKFIKIAFVRPSFLVGPRKEFRLMEKVMQVLMIFITPFLQGPLKKYRPIQN